MDIPAFDGFNGKKKDGSPFRIMVVDDSPFMLKQIQNFLQAIKCDVVATALNGKQALGLYPQVRPDIITLDITMPEMDGIATLEGLMQIDPQVKVIMVSALGHENMVKESIAMGAKYFIVKPLTLSKITSTLVPILRKLG